MTLILPSIHPYPAFYFNFPLFLPSLLFNNFLSSYIETLWVATAVYLLQNSSFSINIDVCRAYCFTINVCLAFSHWLHIWRWEERRILERWMDGNGSSSSSNNKNLGAFHLTFSNLPHSIERALWTKSQREERKKRCFWKFNLILNTSNDKFIYDDRKLWALMIFHQ